MKTNLIKIIFLSSWSTLALFSGKASFAGTWQSIGYTAKGDSSAYGYYVSDPGSGINGSGPINYSGTFDFTKTVMFLSKDWPDTINVGSYSSGTGSCSINATLGRTYTWIPDPRNPNEKPPPTLQIYEAGDCEYSYSNIPGLHKFDVFANASYLDGTPYSSNYMDLHYEYVTRSGSLKDKTDVVDASSGVINRSMFGSASVSGTDDGMSVSVNFYSMPVLNYTHPNVLIVSPAPALCTDTHGAAILRSGEFTDPSASITSVNIYRSKDNGEFLKIANVPYVVRPVGGDEPIVYTDLDIDYKSGYDYFLRWVDINGTESDDSYFESLDPTILPHAPIHVTAGLPVSIPLSAIGGAEKYRLWVLTDNPQYPSILDDLSVDGDNLVGTPKKPGNYNINVALLCKTKYNNNDYLNLAPATEVNSTVMGSYTINVDPAPTLQISTQTLPMGIVGVDYNTLLQASGGSGTYNWYLTDESIPEGLDLYEDGNLVGTPTWHFASSSNLHVQVQDESGQTATASLPLGFNIPAEEDIASTDISSLEACLNNSQYFLYDWPTSPTLSSTFYPLPSDSGIGVPANQAPQVQGSPKANATTVSGIAYEATCHTSVNYDVAFSILDNLRSGDTAGFKPLGVGGCSWFTSVGNPHSGVSDEARITLPARVKVPTDRLIFITGSDITQVQRIVPTNLQSRAINLDQMFVEMVNDPHYQNIAMSNYFNDGWKRSSSYDSTLSITSADFQKYFLNKIYRNVNKKTIKINNNPIERLMWERVGQMVKNSAASGGPAVGEVYLGTPNDFSQFSKIAGSGRFLVVADKNYMRIPGRVRGLWTVIDALKKEHLLREADQTYQSAVFRWIEKELSGSTQATVRKIATFRFSPKGMIALRCAKTGFIVVQLAQGAFDIYTAHDKKRAIISVISGTAGALAVGGAVATFGTPLLALGPAGWLGYGALDLVGGGVGYFLGSHVATYIYDLNIAHAPAGLVTFLRTDP